jgi:hypothetical protein
MEQTRNKRPRHGLLFKVSVKELAENGIRANLGSLCRAAVFCLFACAKEILSKNKGHSPYSFQW